MGLTTFTSFHAPHVALTDSDFFTENFQRKKKKNQLWGLEPTVIPFVGASATTTGVPRYQATLVELRLNHTFNIQLILVFTVS